MAVYSSCGRTLAFAQRDVNGFNTVSGDRAERVNTLTESQRRAYYLLDSSHIATLFMNNVLKDKMYRSTWERVPNQPPKELTLGMLHDMHAGIWIKQGR